MRCSTTHSWSSGNTKLQASSAHKDTLSIDEVLHYTFLVLWQHKVTGFICTQRHIVNRWGAPLNFPGPQATQSHRLHLHTDTLSIDEDLHYTFLVLWQHKLTHNTQIIMSTVAKSHFVCLVKNVVISSFPQNSNPQFSTLPKKHPQTQTNNNTHIQQQQHPKKPHTPKNNHSCHQHSGKILVRPTGSVLTKWSLWNKKTQEVR